MREQPKRFQPVCIPPRVSLRLEAKEAKRLARQKGVPYTVLLRMWIKEKLEESGKA